MQRILKKVVIDDGVIEAAWVFESDTWDDFIKVWDNESDSIRLVSENETVYPVLSTLLRAIKKTQEKRIKAQFYNEGDYESACDAEYLYTRAFKEIMYL